MPLFDALGLLLWKSHLFVLYLASLGCMLGGETLRVRGEDENDISNEKTTAIVRFDVDGHVQQCVIVRVTLV